MEKRALIVGGGLVGSLWAVLLAKRGYEVDVFEQRPDPRSAGFIGGRSINLAMSTRGWRALEKAGIESRIRPAAIAMYGRMMHSVEGELTFQPYGRDGQAIYSVSRGGLNIELIRIADSYDNLRFHFGQKCLGVGLDSNTVYFESVDTGVRTSMQAPLIFGADGAFSAVRRSLMKLPRFNYSQSYLEYGYKELHIPPKADGSHAIDKNALHIWPRGNFMMIALPNIDGSFTGTLFLPFEGEGQAFEQLQSSEQALAFFEAYFPDSLPLFPDLEHDFRTNPTSALATIRCSPWCYEDKVLLLGDAAHAIVPFYGQGMNAGFEDCSILDEMIGQYQDDWTAIIGAFNRERIDDGNAVATLALRNFVEMRDLVADPLFLLRKEIAAHLQEKYPGEFLPLYSQVTFSHIPYSEALKEGDAQEELLSRILSLPGILHNWKDNPEVDAIFRLWQRERQG
ncbi:MAG: FAD-dependent monooxygenase [Phaeodactylibacter sp.]|nr:FAD-dependent monooxygenase [Phaeodactylibacter sp.]MCB9276711.1 FAD-dependent monooxygenase [Lewinellaceae bacterium]